MVLTAAAICVCGVYATFSIATYAFFSKKALEQRLWAGVALICAASSTWATHFIAMLAFHPGAPSAFDPRLTLVSFLLALGVIGLGIAGAVYATSWVRRALAGAVIGTGISLMHYVGMAAYRVPGQIRWDMATVFASVSLSLLFGALGANFAFSADRRVRGLAPPSMLLAVCALHFVGMSAVTIIYDPTQVMPRGMVPPEVLSAVTAIAALLVIGMALIAVMLHRAAKQRRRAERQRLGDLADIALEGLLICRGDLIVSANASLCALSGRRRDDVVGRNLIEILGVVALDVPEEVEREGVLTCAGEAIAVRLQRRAIVVANHPHHVIAVRDQRDRLRNEARIRDLAYTDALTGLPNRARFNELLEGRLLGRRHDETPFAVMMIDLDRFKAVNDKLGHAAGDQLLRRVAGRLQAAIREGDVVARLGGDEFAVLQQDARSEADTRTLAGRLIDLLARPFIIEGQVVNIGGSVGVAIAPSDGDAAEALMRCADLAAYEAKAGGRGTFRLFEAELDAQMQHRRGLESDLRRAVARHEFELLYQPLVDGRSGEVTGAEALIRWRHPERGQVSPADFIPLAEETGLIANIGQWVLRKACSEATRWPLHMSVAVNLSPVQFRDPRLSDMVKEVLASTGLAPERLELEITEGVLIADDGRTLDTLTELRACGVRISMDDFGTDYSSLSYLRRFPFDKIKVDQSFIRQLPDNVESAAIVRAILTMSACLGLKTTVEGVETAEQLAFTAQEGCDQVQGFLISKPLTGQALMHFLERKEAA